MQVRNHHDLWAGLMFIAFGGIFMILSQQYQIGTAAKMGPGYFPMILGGLLALLGLAISLSAFSKGNHEARISPVGWRELGLILFAVLLFAATLPQLGIVIALLVLILVSSLASHEFKLKDTLLGAVFLIVLTYIVFVKGLELQFPLWPKFLSN